METKAHWLHMYEDDVWHHIVLLDDDGLFMVTYVMKHGDFFDRDKGSFLNYNGIDHIIRHYEHDYKCFDTVINVMEDDIEKVLMVGKI